MKRIVVWSIGCLFLLATPASAQICTGQPSFRTAGQQVGFGAAFTDNARGVGGTFAAGGDALFGGAGLAVTNYTALDSLETTVSAFGGADLATENERVFLCPLAGVSFGVGPDLGAVDVSTFGLRGGGSVGVVASDGDGLMVVPTFGLAAVYRRLTLDFGDDEESEGDTSGAASIGVGFIFNDTVGITPLLVIPFSAGSSDVIFSLGFTFNFG